MSQLCTSPLPASNSWKVSILFPFDFFTTIWDIMWVNTDVAVLYKSISMLFNTDSSPPLSYPLLSQLNSHRHYSCHGNSNVGNQVPGSHFDLTNRTFPCGFQMNYFANVGKTHTCGPMLLSAGTPGPGTLSPLWFLLNQCIVSARLVST